MTPIRKNILWLILEYGLRVAVNMVAAAFIGRALGVSGYGIFQYALSITAVFITLSYICGAEVVVPRLIETKNSVTDTATVIGSAAIIRIAAAIVAYSILVLFALSKEHGPTLRAIIIFGAMILLSEPSQIVTAWFQSRTNIGPKSAISILSLLLKLATVTFLYLNQATDISAYAAAWLVEFIAMCGGFYFLYTRLIGIRPRVSINEIKRLINFSSTFFIALTLSALLSRLDIFILKSVGADMELGLYSAAAQFHSGILALSPIFIMSLAPKWIYEINDRRIIKKNIYKMTLLLGAVGLVVFIFVAALSSYAINALYGKSFYGSGRIWLFLSIGMIFAYMDSALNTYFIKYRHGGLLAAKAATLLCIGYLFYQHFIYKYGALGAAYGYIITSFCSLTFNAFLIKHLNRTRGAL